VSVQLQSFITAFTARHCLMSERYLLLALPELTTKGGFQHFHSV
jgi:hypothetical protein